MPVIQLKSIKLAYGAEPLLDEVDLSIEAGERICLVGRNGAGKSTLMRILVGDEKPDAGERTLSAGTLITRLPQEVPAGLSGSVSEILAEGFDESRHLEDWEKDQRLDELSKGMQLEGDVSFESLSGGVKRRVLLGRALVSKPDLLLLDEPTNHLDLEAILWLEEFLVSSGTSLFFVTHDRTFLRKLATRILQLVRGQLTSWDCDYDTFVKRRDESLEAEEKQWASFDKKLAQEEAWLRQGIKARRTRNEGRVKALQKLRVERSRRRERTGQVKLEIQEGTTSGRKVIEAEGVSFSYGEQTVLQEVSTTIWRGDKIGILGPNGAGKTTLLRILLGELEAQQGTVELGTNLQVVFLDQMRGQIDDEKSVAWNVAADAETVTFQGQPRHIHSYLQDFLFRSDRIRMAARHLSGGERNRLLLARLFLQPANLLVLDEPTNDLDADTLDLLEELLVSYEGTLLLVSHDRAFLDNVVNGMLVFEGEGRVVESPGGYSDWLQQRGQRQKLSDDGKQAAAGGKPAARKNNTRARKFLNRERRELDGLPDQIETLEREQAELTEKLADPSSYTGDPKLVPQLQQQLAELEAEKQRFYARWEELEALRVELEG